MPDIDYAMAFDFIDPTDRRQTPRQLRFTLNWAPPGDPRLFDGTGQLVAVTAKDEHTLAISRPGVDVDDVNNALEGWETWAAITRTTYDLNKIRRRIDNAGLGRMPHHASS